MKNDELIESLLKEAEKLKVKDHVLHSVENLMRLNPQMDKLNAVQLALNNAKLHSGFFSKKNYE
jgi:hypothetical protein